MRIVIDAVAASNGGAGLIRVREIARTFSGIRPEHEFLFVVRPELESEVRRVAPGAQILCPPKAFSRTPARLGWEHVLLPRQVRAFRPEVVFSPFNVVPTIWPKPTPGIAVMVSNLAPYSGLVRSMECPRERLRNALLKFMTNRSLARADRVFLQSRHALSLIGESRLGGKAQVVAPVPAPLLPPNDSLECDVPPGRYFVVTSDLYAFKGVETAIEALPLLRDDPDTTLVVCGRPMQTDYVAALEAQIQRLELRGRVRLLGAVPHHHALTLMRHAQACIAPSRFENLSKVPAEAMSVDTPVIASDIPSYREGAGAAALYFDPGNAPDLASQILRLLTNHGLRDRLVEQGRARLNGLDSMGAAAELLDSLERLR